MYKFRLNIEKSEGDLGKNYFTCRVREKLLIGRAGLAQRCARGHEDGKDGGTDSDGASRLVWQATT